MKGDRAKSFFTGLMFWAACVVCFVIGLKLYTAMGIKLGFMIVFAGAALFVVGAVFISGALFDKKDD